MRLLLSALTITIFTFIAGSRPAVSQSAPDEPSVLVVTAHPDDEAMFAATMYRVTHALGGTVDLALVTDGAGGYRFSTLAEPLYGRDLTDESTARQYLPAIRKRELMAGGEIVGIRDYFFIDQPDEGKTEDADSVMTHVWDSDVIAGRLDHILAEGEYDFIFTHLPIMPFHAHHKAATILALQAVERMDPAERPIILGSFTTGGMDDVVASFDELEGHPITRIRRNPGPFTFDRGTPLGLEGRLDYTIVVNWLIAEHKSQGTMQLFLTSEPSVERFWLYDMNAPSADSVTGAFFERVQTAPTP